MKTKGQIWLGWSIGTTIMLAAIGGAFQWGSGIASTNNKQDTNIAVLQTQYGDIKSALDEIKATNKEILAKINRK